MKAALKLAWCLVSLALLSVTGAPAQTSKKVVIGAIIPLTGGGAQSGMLMQRGIEMAISDINAAGGLEGTELSVRYADAGDQPSNGPTALRRMKEIDGIEFSVIANSNVTLATVPVATELKIVLINGGGQSNKLVGASPWLFNVIPPTNYEIARLAEWAAKALGKSAVVTYSTDPIGKDAWANWQEFFEKAGGKIITAESVAFGQSDFRSALVKLREAARGADFWFVGGTYGADAVRLFDQARNIGIKIQIVSGAVTPGTIDPAQPLLKGLIHTKLETKPTDDYRTRFKARFNAEPDFYSSAYYEAVTIYAEAKKYAKGKGYEGAEGLRRAIAEIKSFTTPAGSVAFDERNATQSGLEIVKRQEDGSLAVLAE